MGRHVLSNNLLGNLTKGAANIQLMNALGYQFPARGNHDLDYGTARTRELQQRVQCSRSRSSWHPDGSGVRMELMYPNAVLLLADFIPFYIAAVLFALPRQA